MKYTISVTDWNFEFFLSDSRPFTDCGFFLIAYVAAVLAHSGFGLFRFSQLFCLRFRTYFLVWCCSVCLLTDFFSMTFLGWSCDFFGYCSCGTGFLTMTSFSCSPGKAAGWILFLIPGTGSTGHDSMFITSPWYAFVDSEAFSFAANCVSTSQMSLCNNLYPLVWIVQSICW